MAEPLQIDELTLNLLNDHVEQDRFVYGPLITMLDNGLRDGIPIVVVNEAGDPIGTVTGKDRFRYVWTITER